MNEDNKAETLEVVVLGNGVDRAHTVIRDAKNTDGLLMHMIFAHARRVLRIMGLYHEPNDYKLVKLYCILIVVLMWLQAVRFLSAFNVFWGEVDTFNAILVMKMTILLYFTISAVNATVMYILHEDSSRIRQLDRLFDDFNGSYKLLDKKSKRFTRLSISLFTVFFFLSFLCIVSVFYSYFGRDESFTAALKDTLAPFHRSTWAASNAPYKLLCGLFATYCAFNVIFVPCYFLVYTVILTETYKSFNDFMDFAIENAEFTCKKSTGSIFKTLIHDWSADSIMGNKKIELNEQDLEDMNELNLKLTTVSRTTDYVFREFIGLNLLAYIPMTFMDLYVASDYATNCVKGVFAIIIPIWVTLAISILLLITVAASRIHTHVRSFRSKQSQIRSSHAFKGNMLYKQIYYFKITNHSPTFYSKFQILISKLVNDRIGLTAWDIFVIDKPLIQTVILTVISYYFFLVKFKENIPNATNCIGL